ncbi:MAG: HAD family hydrolase [Pseudomonadales bacterium]
MAAGVLFDLDETLLDRAASVAAYGLKFYSDFESAIESERESFLATFLLLDGQGYVPRERFFESMSNAMGAGGPDAEVIASHFAAHAWQEPTLMQGAAEGLRRLRDAGVPLAVVTNGGSSNQRKKLVNSGLDQLVDEICISEELGVRKPHPDIFRHALDRLGVRADRSWFVGDNPQADVIGAAAVGCRTIWLRRTLPWPDDQPLRYTAVVDTLEPVFDWILGSV